jgi:integrase
METGRLWEDDPIAFAEWMLQQKSLWKRSTWRTTRLAVREHILKEGGPLEAVQHFDDGHNPPGSAPGKFTTRRVKGMPDDDLARLLDLLTDPQAQREHHLRGGTYDRILAAFLRANIQVGLRPSEWDTARLSILDDEPLLRVQNRKTTNGRSNGTERLLSLEPGVVPSIKAMLEERDRFYNLGATWAEIQAGMAVRIQEIRHLVTKKTYTLYSTRHRFVSAAKQSGYGKQEIADMLGHASEDTASMHYGRKHARTVSGGRALVHNVATAGEGNTRPLISVTRGEGVKASQDQPSPANGAARTEEIAPREHHLP